MKYNQDLVQEAVREHYARLLPGLKFAVQNLQQQIEDLETVLASASEVPLKGAKFKSAGFVKLKDNHAKSRWDNATAAQRRKWQKAMIEGRKRKEAQAK